jgi:hypothetical protein
VGRAWPNDETRSRGRARFRIHNGTWRVPCGHALGRIHYDTMSTTTLHLIAFTIESPQLLVCWKYVSQGGLVSGQSHQSHFLSWKQSFLSSIIGNDPYRTMAIVTSLFLFLCCQFCISEAVGLLIPRSCRIITRTVKTSKSSLPTVL